jgi:phage baseplate assembly protein W
MSELDFPYHLDERGHTAGTDYAEHVRDMIEQLLLTSPGERVNRPDFGSGLLQMVFAPNSPEIAAALQFSIQAALQRWLGDVIETRELTVEAEDAQLRITLEYELRATGEVQTATFQGGAAS